MRVPARIYATEKLMQEMDDGVFDQVTNVATLPGILKYAYCMPDGHWGYGFPIGGVAAMDARNGVISPGGIGFDVNCGMRLVPHQSDLRGSGPELRELVDKLFDRVPAGVGCNGFVRISQDEFRRVVEQGARWCVQQGYGWREDLERTEEDGCIAGADSGKISNKAVERGYKQIGTLGSGNHYLEIQVAKPENVMDAELARDFRDHAAQPGGGDVPLREPRVSVIRWPPTTCSCSSRSWKRNTGSRSWIGSWPALRSFPRRVRTILPP